MVRLVRGDLDRATHHFVEEAPVWLRGADRGIGRDRPRVGSSLRHTMRKLGARIRADGCSQGSVDGCGMGVRIDVFPDDLLAGANRDLARRVRISARHKNLDGWERVATAKTAGAHEGDAEGAGKGQTLCCNHGLLSLIEPAMFCARSVAKTPEVDGQVTGGHRRIACQGGTSLRSAGSSFLLLGC